jgi:hypothetical protein
MKPPYAKLRRLNLIAAALHLGQAIAIWLLATNYRLPITYTYLRFSKVTMSLIPATKQLATVSLANLIILFFLLSAVAHLIIATVYNRRYNQGLAKGINRARWVEYSLSASVMIVAIGLLVGIYDLGTLITMFGLVAVMNLCGLIMEVHNQTTPKTNWLSYWVGCLAGAFPWVVVALYLWAGAHNGSPAPTFVYWIFVSIFIFFSSFAVNMVLQYKKIGPWRDYLYGERVYIILSLVAKSLLAWQVFAGTLRP